MKTFTVIQAMILQIQRPFWKTEYKTVVLYSSLLLVTVGMVIYGLVTIHLHAS